MNDVERAVGFMARASQLLDLAAKTRERDSQQVLIATAQEYERSATALIPELRSMIRISK